MLTAVRLYISQSLGCGASRKCGGRGPDFPPQLAWPYPVAVGAPRGEVVRDQPHFDVQERPAINGYAFPRERDLCLIHAPLARSTCVLRAATGTGRAACVDGATSGAARFTLWLAPSHVAASASCVRRDALSVLSHSVASTGSVACGAPAAAGLPAAAAPPPRRRRQQQQQRRRRQRRHRQRRRQERRQEQRRRPRAAATDGRSSRLALPAAASSSLPPSSSSPPLPMPPTPMLAAGRSALTALTALTHRCVELRPLRRGSRRRSPLSAGHCCSHRRRAAPLRRRRRCCSRR
jgi:hypothetical protein